MMVLRLAISIQRPEIVQAVLVDVRLVLCGQGVANRCRAGRCVKQLVRLYQCCEIHASRCHVLRDIECRRGWIDHILSIHTMRSSVVCKLIVHVTVTATCPKQRVQRVRIRCKICVLEDLVGAEHVVDPSRNIHGDQLAC